MSVPRGVHKRVWEARMGRVWAAAVCAGGTASRGWWPAYAHGCEIRVCVEADTRACLEQHRTRTCASKRACPAAHTRIPRRTFARSTTHMRRGAQQCAYAALHTRAFPPYAPLLTSSSSSAFSRFQTR
eukprot:1576606-Rhodomonas_salina.1